MSLINSYASQIADINQRILLARAGSQTQEPNDLLDQRDQLIADLNKQVRVTTLVQSDGTFNVFFGNGQPLVVGTESYALERRGGQLTTRNGWSSSMRTPGGTTTAGARNRRSPAAAWAALISFRSGLARQRPERARPDRHRALTQTFNDQHQLGQDLTGALGGDFFSVAESDRLFQFPEYGGAAASAAAFAARRRAT